MKSDALDYWMNRVGILKNWNDILYFILTTKLTLFAVKK